MMRWMLVWDVRSGRFIKELPTGMLTNVAFSPDGKWLATGNTRRFQYWRVSTWALDREIPRAPGMGLPGPIAFSETESKRRLAFRRVR